MSACNVLCVSAGLLPRADRCTNDRICSPPRLCHCRRAPTPFYSWSSQCTPLYIVFPQCRSSSKSISYYCPRVQPFNKLHHQCTDLPVTIFPPNVSTLTNAHTIILFDISRLRHESSLGVARIASNRLTCVTLPCLTIASSVRYRFPLSLHYLAIVLLI